MDPLRESLAKVSLFRDLNDQELDRISAIVIPRVYRKKTVIFIEGAEKEAVYIIQEGMVKTFKTDENGQEQIVNLLSEGSMFPHTGIYSEAPYPATAETLVDTKVLAIPLKQFETLLLSTPTVAVKVMRVMGKTIMELQAKLQELTGQEVQMRAQSFLIAMAEKLVPQQSDSQSDTVPHKSKSITLPLPITHQEFANVIGTTRETVTRLLSQWKKEHLVEATRGGFIIHDLDQLKQWRSSK